VAVLLGVIAAVAAAWFCLPVDGRFSHLALTGLVSGTAVCLTGAVDDRWLLSSRTKLILQVAAVAPLVWSGYGITQIQAFGVPIHFGAFGMVITATWLVGCINAMNFLDGMDGLASLIGLVVALVSAVIAGLVGNSHAALLGICLAGALAGFLVHNLPPARIFLGDSGSMLIGLLLGLIGIAGTMKTPTTLAIAVPVLLMALPILDTVLAIVRRKLTGRRVDVADREHIHHRLLDRGLSQRQALVFIGGVCLATGLASIVAVWLRSDMIAWLAAAFAVAIPIRTKWFGQHELHLARRAAGQVLEALGRLIGGESVASGGPQLPPHQETSFGDAWNLLVEQVELRRADSLEMLIWNGDRRPRRHGWRRRGPKPSPNATWQLAVTMRKPTGEQCRLTAEGAATPSVEQHERDMDLLLRVFAVHFIERAETIPGLLVVDEDPTAEKDHPLDLAA
jgi:UDP-GlcNAc:undecaprenyl-phosphate GlcNAc-1-phosphate transferase